MMPPEHFNQIKTRLWHKVRWRSAPDKWKGIEGQIDLLTDDDLKAYKNSVDIIESYSVETCKTLPVLGFGKMTEEKISEWIKANTGNHND